MVKIREESPADYAFVFKIIEDAFKDDENCLAIELYKGGLDGVKGTIEYTP